MSELDSFRSVQETSALHMQESSTYQNGPRRRMAQHDDVRVARDHLDAVLERFALPRGRGRLVDVDDAPAEPLHGGREAAAGARARLVEDGRHHLAAQQVVQQAVLRDARLHRLREVEDLVQVLLAEHVDGEDVPAGQLPLPVRPAEPARHRLVAGRVAPDAGRRQWRHRAQQGRLLRREVYAELFDVRATTTASSGSSSSSSSSTVR
uniref:Uncharacterized protein n=1 Tax=Anopheles dirus TaxID=7168 RepID=A0A182NW55_9DIPT